MEPTAWNERRRHERQVFVRGCKLRDRRRAAFTPGETCDVSAGGALVRVGRNHQFAPGDEVELAVAWDERPLLTSDAAVRGRVRRVTPIDFHHQAVAIEFRHALESPLAAAA